jgi:hypothetical protein
MGQGLPQAWPFCYFILWPPLAIYTTHNRDISKVRKRQHQYPKFGHTQGKNKKSTLAFKGVGGGETQETIKIFPSFTLSFFYPERLL